MIELKAPEGLVEAIEETRKQEETEKKLNPDAYYLKEISKTPKEILREMRKREWIWTT